MYTTIMLQKNPPLTNVKIVMTAYAIGEKKYDSISRRAIARAWRILGLLLPVPVAGQLQEDLLERQ